MNKRIRVEFHCHSEYSFDGLIRIDSLFKVARLVGLDVVAVTDHDTIEGGLEADRYSKRRPKSVRDAISIIVGEERTLDSGVHVIGLFLREPLSSTTFFDLREEINAQGGLCLVPHPFRKKDGLLAHCAGMEDKLSDYKGAVEIYNGKGSGQDNIKAQRLLGGFPAVGGSDAHYESDLGACVNVLDWTNSVRSSVGAVFAGERQALILGRPQGADAPERKYAPLYYKLKKCLRIPRPLVPTAKEVYRRYRNLRYGVGEKRLEEVIRGAS